MSRIFSAAVMAAVLCWTPPTLAEEVTEAARSAARTLGYEGVAAFQKGDFQTAAQKLDLAFKVVKVPTIGLWSARSLVKIGKLVDAYNRYTEVITLPVTEGKVAAQEKAQAEAATEGTKLLGRIPTVLISFRGASESEILLTIDGKVVPQESMGKKKLLDPGLHTVIGKFRAEVATERVNLAEGDQKEVVLSFGGVGDFAAAPGEAEPEAPASEKPPSKPGPVAADHGDDSGSGYRTAAWVAFGAGGVGVAVMGVAGGLALKKKSSLSDSCRGDVCDPAVQGDVDSYNTLRAVSTAGFITGVVGLASGAALLLMAPSQESPDASVHAWIGVGSAGVAGRF